MMNQLIVKQLTVLLWKNFTLKVGKGIMGMFKRAYLLHFSLCTPVHTLLRNSKLWVDLPNI